MHHIWTHLMHLHSGVIRNFVGLKFTETAAIIPLIPGKQWRATMVSIGGNCGKLEWEWELQLALEVSLEHYL